MSNIDEIKNLIHSLPPEILESRGVLKKAKKGYVCPLCGNGEGRDGTGIEMRDVNGTFLGKCFKCNAGFDNFKLLGLHYQLDPRNDADFIELCKRTCSDFGIVADFGDKYFDDRRKFDRVMKKFATHATTAPVQPTIQYTEAVSPDPAELELILADISDAQKNLDSIPDTACRGLSKFTLKTFGCGFIGNWTHPKSRLKGYRESPTPRLIIPTPNHYLARLVVDKNSFPEFQREYIKEKVHAGSKEIFNLDAALADADKSVTHVLVVTEGEIDAMSFWQCAPLPIVATGGTSGWQKLLAQLKKRGYGTGKIIRLLIMFDSDDAGRKAAEEFRSAALDATIPAVTFFLSTDVCKIDANDILREKGEDALTKIYGDFYLHDSEAKFTAAEYEIASRQAAKLAEDEAAVNKIRTEDPDVNRLLFELPFNDVYNARRIILIYGDKFRFIRETEHWLTYDNGVWNVGSKSNATIYPLANQMYDLLKIKQPPIADTNDGILLKEYVRQWGKKNCISAAVELMKFDSAITITQNDLNRHPELLNVANGTVDLTTGRLYPHRAQDLLTQKIYEPYIPNAVSPVVNGFFKSILPDEVTRAALIRFLGYCTTGFARERVALFIWGEGGNGKSTLVLAINALMGDYACEFPVKALLLNRFDTDGDKPTPSIAMLNNRRFAFVDEIPASSTLDETKFKYLTGDNPLVSRNLNENFFTNRHPTHKFILSGNHMPELKDPNDPALQDRLIRVNFLQHFTKNSPDYDPHLKDKLLASDAQRALLALLVNAAFDYCRAGLLESPSMKAAKRDYLIEQDFISEFISENCERDDSASIPRPELIRRIKAECDGAKGMSSKAISAALDKINGLEKITIRGTVNIKGVRWRAQQ